VVFRDGLGVAGVDGGSVVGTETERNKWHVALITHRSTSHPNVFRW
jgi:hypothetical protein